MLLFMCVFLALLVLAGYSVARTARKREREYKLAKLKKDARDDLARLLR